MARNLCNPEPNRKKKQRTLNELQALNAMSLSPKRLDLTPMSLQRRFLKAYRSPVIAALLLATFPVDIGLAEVRGTPDISIP